MKFRRFFNLSNFGAGELPQPRKLHFIVWSLLLVLNSECCVFFYLLPHNWVRWLVMIITLDVTSPLLLFLNHRGHSRLAGALLLAYLWLLITVSVLTAGGIHAPGVLAYVVSVVIAGLLFGGKGGVTAGFAFCLTGLVFALLEITGQLPERTVIHTTISIWASLTAILALAAIFQVQVSLWMKAALQEAKREVDRRRRAETALSESEERYREVFENTSDCIFLLDVTAEGQFIFRQWNPTCEEIFGVASADIVGQPLAKCFPNYCEEITANFEQCVTRGFPVSYEETMFYHGKNWHFHTTLIPVKNAAGRTSRLVGVSHNITERKQAETALRQSRDELEVRVQERTAELQKANKDLEAYSYSISHDLRSPLRTMTGFADILISDYAHDLPADAQDFLARIKNSAVRMNQLVEDLLKLSSFDRQPLLLRTVNLAALASQTITELRAEHPDRNLDFRLGDLPECMADPVLIRQVFINLLDNAVKFTGTRSVALIEIGSTAEEGETICFVRDNGVGFDMQYAGKLFGDFQRLHSTGLFPGTGVGLSLVRRIIERHHGKVWAESAVDHGATFYFTLPQSDQKPVRAPVSASRGVGTRQGSAFEFEV